MREGIGSISLYNIIIIFIAVTFALLAATMSYSKAFKVNSNIINALEIFEGYNDLSAEEIDRVLNGIGYRLDENNCDTSKYNVIVDRGNNYNYNFCLNLSLEKTKDYNKRYFTYEVTSYMYFDLPFIQTIKIPVRTKTSRIFCFNYRNVCERLVS